MDWTATLLKVKSLTGLQLCNTAASIYKDALLRSSEAVTEGGRLSPLVIHVAPGNRIHGLAFLHRYNRSD